MGPGVRSLVLCRGTGKRIDSGPLVVEEVETDPISANCKGQANARHPSTSDGVRLAVVRDWVSDGVVIGTASTLHFVQRWSTFEAIMPLRFM